MTAFLPAVLYNQWCIACDDATIAPSLYKHTLEACNHFLV